jgi:hypothetical protein
MVAVREHKKRWRITLALGARVIISNEQWEIFGTEAVAWKKAIAVATGWQREHERSVIAMMIEELWFVRDSQNSRNYGCWKSAVHLDATNRLN